MAIINLFYYRTRFQSVCTDRIKLPLQSLLEKIYFFYNQELKINK